MGVRRAMRLRLAKLDAYQFLVCVKHNLWGSRNNRFRTWKEGDYLALLVDKYVAGLGQVAGPPYRSDEPVWDNGTFPYRLPVKFTHVTLPEQRVPILGLVRDVLIEEWGTHYGVGIRNQQLLSGKHAAIIVEEILKHPNHLSDILADIETYLHEAKPKDIVTSAKLGKIPSVDVTPQPPNDAAAEAASVNGQVSNDDAPHSAAQLALIQLGRITGCDVWIATNDRSRLYRGEPLGRDCLSTLPNMGLSEEAARRAALIDVIWFRQNAPVCAFEVETTTSIYSGLLRMSDLLALVPALNMKLFVVAPGERQAKALEELGRPTFKKIGLSDYCRFISIETLQALLSKVEGLRGHVQPTIVNTIAVDAGEQVKGALDQ